jgi:hypothetical protein
MIFSITKRLFSPGAARPVKPRPTLIGHSHVEPILAAAKSAGRPLNGFNFWTAPQPAISADRSAFHTEIAGKLAHGTVVSVVGGAVHNVIGLVQHPVAFDFILPWRADLPLDDHATFLPFDTVSATMSHYIQEYLDIIGLVRATATGPVYHVEAPPPLEDSERILADVPWAFFPNLTHDVSPASLRYKLWLLANDLTQRYCSQRGISILHHPPAAIDQRGYLRPDLYGDAMHVNEAYGAMVFAQIEAL